MFTASSAVWTFWARLPDIIVLVRVHQLRLTTGVSELDVLATSAGDNTIVASVLFLLKRTKESQSRCCCARCTGRQPVIRNQCLSQRHARRFRSRLSQHGQSRLPLASMCWSERLMLYCPDSRRTRHLLSPSCKLLCCWNTAFCLLVIRIFLVGVAH